MGGSVGMTRPAIAHVAGLPQRTVRDLSGRSATALINRKPIDRRDGICPNTQGINRLRQSYAQRADHTGGDDRDAILFYRLVVKCHFKGALSIASIPVAF